MTGRRWAPAAFVAILLLLSSMRPQISSADANAGAAKKRYCDRFDCHFLHKKATNSSSLEDDKRVVPTGPNPLHNL